MINKMTSIEEGQDLIAKSGGRLIDRAHVEKAMEAGIHAYALEVPESQFIPYDARNIRLPHLEEFLRKYPHFLHEPEKYLKEAY